MLAGRGAGRLGSLRNTSSSSSSTTSSTTNTDAANNSSSDRNNIENTDPSQWDKVSPSLRAHFPALAAMVVEALPQATVATAEDKRVVAERQVCHDVWNIAAVGQRCKHGFPQAYVQMPFGKAFASGMIRLSCPHLVKEIDVQEREGGVELVNSLARGDSAEV